MKARPRSNDQGDTLVELIIAITILGICVVAIGTTIALSVRISAVHRNQATAVAFLHNYAETLETKYQPCAGAGTPSPNYVTLGSLPAPTGFDAPSATVKYWDPNAAPPAFNTTTCPAPDPGLQQVTLTLATSDGSVAESLVVVLRNAT